jgi:hypothetical protein
MQQSKRHCTGREPHPRAIFPNSGALPLGCLSCFSAFAAFEREPRGGRVTRVARHIDRGMSRSVRQAAKAAANDCPNLSDNPRVMCSNFQKTGRDGTGTKRPSLSLKLQAEPLPVGEARFPKSLQVATGAFCFYGLSTLSTSSFANGALGKHRRQESDGIRLEIDAPRCRSILRSQRSRTCGIRGRSRSATGSRLRSRRREP